MLGKGLCTFDAITGGGYKIPRRITYTYAAGNPGYSEIDSTMTGPVPAHSTGRIEEGTF